MKRLIPLALLLASLALQAQVRVTFVGNDSKPQNAVFVDKEFADDAESLVRIFQSLPTHPRVILVTPTWFPRSSYGISDKVSQEQVCPALYEAAKRTGAEVLDLYPVLQDAPETLAGDGIHPDAAYRNGRYYFYFPHPSGTHTGSTWKIGVATSDKPASDFKVGGYIQGMTSYYDPCVFVDDDGQAYIYNGGGGRCFGARLRKDMIRLAGKMVPMEGLVDFHEGPGSTRASSWTQPTATPRTAASWSSRESGTCSTTAASSPGWAISAPSAWTGSITMRTGPSGRSISVTTAISPVNKPNV